MTTDTREALAALPTEAQVLAAARMLCKIHAGQCQVDEEDTWKVYGEQFKDDAREALAAALATQPAQPGDKLWCETCEGTRGVYEEPQIGVPGSGGDIPCPDCDGKGYWTRRFTAATQPEYKFGRTYCSQCGGEFGQGNSGCSHCQDHMQPAQPEPSAQGEALPRALLRKALVKAARTALPQSHTHEYIDSMEYWEANLRAFDASAPAAPAQPSVTEEMVTAYLTANDAYWKRIDGEPTKLGKWRNGTPSEATRVSLMAALAAAPAAPAQAVPLETWSIERAADMLTAYAELVKATGRYAEEHYIPEIESVAAELRGIKAAP